MTENAVIIGSGDFADLVYDVLLRTCAYEVLGFFSPSTSSKARLESYISCLGGDDQIALLTKDTKLFLGVGNPDMRISFFNQFSQLGYIFPPLIDPSAQISKFATIKDGCFIGYGSCLLPHVEVGICTVVGTSVSILHHALIGDACQLGGNTTVGANNCIQSYVKIGVGSQIASGPISVHSRSVLAAGSVLHDSVDEPSFLLGNPARRIPSLLLS